MERTFRLKVARLSESMNNPKVILAVGFAIGLVSLAGCAGKTRYPSYYVLNLPAPVAPSVPPAPILGTAAIREFRAPGFLTSGPIVYRPSREQVGFYNYDHWVEDPRRVVTAAMIRELRARGIFQSVEPFDGRGSPAYLISGTLDHLEEIDDGTSVSIEVGLSASLLNATTGEVLWRGASSQTARVDQHSVPGVVAEMSRDLSIAVERLVSSMQNRISAASPVASYSSVDH
jgi:cholesterol transport system auxiliary component